MRLNNTGRCHPHRSETRSGSQAPTDKSVDTASLPFWLFPLCPPGKSGDCGEAQGLTGKEVMVNGKNCSWLDQKDPAEDRRHSIFICSPYLNQPAFDWLLSQIRDRRVKPDLYLLTCGKNDPRQTSANGKSHCRKHFLNECCETFAKNDVAVYLTVYPGNGESKRSDQQHDPLMHSKLYLCAEGPPLVGDLSKFPEKHDIFSAWFGSMNFTKQGLGLIRREQSFELLARADGNLAKQSLAKRFSYYWCRGGSKRWNTKTGTLREVSKHSLKRTKRVKLGLP